MVEQVKEQIAPAAENPVIPVGESVRVSTEGLGGIVKEVHEGQHIEEVQAAHPEGNVQASGAAVPPPTQLSDVIIQPVDKWVPTEAKKIPNSEGSKWNMVFRNLLARKLRRNAV